MAISHAVTQASTPQANHRLNSPMALQIQQAVERELPSCPPAFPNVAALPLFFLQFSSSSTFHVELLSSLVLCTVFHPLHYGISHSSLVLEICFRWSVTLLTDYLLPRHGRILPSPSPAIHRRRPLGALAALRIFRCCPRLGRRGGALISVSFLLTE